MPKTQIIPCTKEEINDILDAASDNDFYYMLFRVAAKTGRRLGEYFDVQVKDLDFDRKVMMTKVLKRRKPVYKEAILDEDLILLIKRYIAKEKLKLDDYLFRKVSYRGIQNAITGYAKKAGIPHKVSFHNFRHYFCTSLIKQGWSYDKVAKLTGHGSAGTLAIYDHSVASDIADEARDAMANI